MGLHPAVYFYGPSGRHSGPLFMGTVMLLGSRLANNDKGFFRKFTEVRKPLEGILIEYKDLIATLIQKHDSRRRHENYCDFLEALISRLSDNLEVTEPALVEMAGLSGRVVAGIVEQRSKGFSEDVKSQAFITTALKGAIICPICGGYVDVEKSVSYDHAVPRRDGGGGQWKTVSSRIRTAISRSNSDSRCRACRLAVSRRLWVCGTDRLPLPRPPRLFQSFLQRINLLLELLHLHTQPLAARALRLWFAVAIHDSRKLNAHHKMRNPFFSVTSTS